jgi:endonuclease/exonuclease/phosphatase (EEP) superfamily protein YafD
VAAPDPYLVISHAPGGETIEAATPCQPGLLNGHADDKDRRSNALDPEGFSLMVWNMLKGNRQGWEKDFYTLGREADVILLQEAHLTDEMRRALQTIEMDWCLAATLKINGNEAGVMTASEGAPQVICMQQSIEPLLKVPKVKLFTRFPLSIDGRQLVVVNVHAINFTVGTDHFRRSWQTLEAALAPYKGPLIVAGDFNTWNLERLTIVEKTAERLGMQPVRFTPDRRSLIFDQPVDHVYYRGLVPLDASVVDVATSDHNPMRITFKLGGHPIGEQR